ncbi:uncharacterized protein L3040_003168 [Drepanopeziza brunnea f. sp. 'multigermtubi']|nr:hypothetical protein L3040_003168 [Drepanopeziza brunnea f. sp. 'multigermtubi']
MIRMTRSRRAAENSFLNSGPVQVRGAGNHNLRATRMQTTQTIVPPEARIRRDIVAPRLRIPGSLDIDEGTEEEYNIYGEVELATSLSGNSTTTPRVNRDTGGAKIFRSLSLELHQMIALYLPEDEDLINYSRICKETLPTITCSVWRKRFLQYFDGVKGFSPKDLTWRYLFRRTVCQNWIVFDLRGLGLPRIDTGTQKLQRYYQERVLQVIQGVLLESNASVCQDETGNIVVRGSNLSFIADLLTGQNGTSYLDIVDSVFNTSFFDQETANSLHRVVTAADKNTLIYVLQLCLTPFSLHPNYCNHRVNHFDISQFHAYSGPRTQPVCNGVFKQQVNVRWLLHVVNFFKFHLKSEGEGLLAHEYKELELDEIPQFWVGHIMGGTQPLGRHWKGAYTYMDDTSLASLRVWDGQNGDIHTDALDGDEGFQDIDMFFDDASNSKFPWPADWEAVLCSNPFDDIHQQNYAKRKRVPPQNLPGVRQFWGSCRGAKNGHFFGRVHALTVQQGFHGFQRITLIKYYTQVNHNGEHVYDPNQVWAYEGVVLPGGRIIVGRWWSARGNPDSNDTMCGPFMWWNVDRSGPEAIDENEALDFLKSFQDYIEVA